LNQLSCNPEKLDEFGVELVSDCNDVILLKKEMTSIQKEINTFTEKNIEEQKEIDELSNKLFEVRQEHIELNEVLLTKYEQQRKVLEKYSVETVQPLLKGKVEQLEENSEVLADTTLGSENFNEEFISNYRKMREEFHVAKKKLDLLPLQK